MKPANRREGASGEGASRISRNSKGFTDEERAAMRERAKELKAEERSKKDRAAGESDVLAKIAGMSEPDRSIARRLHEIVKTNAPSLSPRTWYGMPAYSDKDGEVVLFFQTKDKFKARYATLGFGDSANLDEGNMWSTSYALQALSPAEERKITDLVKRAVSSE